MMARTVVVLPMPLRPEQRHDLAGADSQRDVEQHLRRAVGRLKIDAPPASGGSPRRDRRRAPRRWRGSPPARRGDDAAVDQHGDAVREGEHRLHVVLDQHDGVAPLQRARGSRRRRSRFLVARCRPAARRAAAASARSPARWRVRAGAFRRATAGPAGTARAVRRGRPGRGNPSPASFSAVFAGGVAEETEARAGRAPARRAPRSPAPRSRGRIEVIWNDARQAAPRPARAVGRLRDVRARRSRMRPASGASRPEIWWISVVLPAPFGPMIACSSPGATSRLSRR